MNMNGFVLELLDISGRRIRKDQVANIDSRAHARMAALIDEANHGVEVIQQAQTKWLQFESDVDILLLCIIAETPAGFDAPLPLGGRRNDFALPDVFAENQQDIFGAPGASEIDEFLAPFDVKFAHGIIE